MKILVPVSGGVDSTYLVVDAINKYGVENVVAMHMDEQRPELTNQIKNVCDYLGIEFVTMPMPNLDMIAMYDHPLTEKHKIPYWIGFKSYMYINALSYGTAHGINEIWFGVYEWNDHFVDELPQSGKLMEDTWRQLYPDVKVPEIKFPLIGLTKKDVIYKCSKLKNFPFHLTYSCFEYNEDTLVHCGKCLGCINRQEEFEKANVQSLLEEGTPVMDRVTYLNKTRKVSLSYVVDLLKPFLPETSTELLTQCLHISQDSFKSELIMKYQLPFFPLGNSLIPVFSMFLPVYHYFYSPCFRDKNISFDEIEVSPVETPIVIPTYEDWETQIRKQNKASHFFGKKSKKVEWSIVPLKDVEFDNNLEMLYINHNTNYASRTSFDLFDSLYETYKFWSNVSEYSKLHNTHSGYMVKATDLETNNLVATMIIYKAYNTIGCSIIAINHEDKYKPYSLAVNAHLKALQLVYTQYQDFIFDLGLNKIGGSEYKKVIHGYTDYPLLELRQEQL